MPDEINFFFGGGAADTQMHLLVAVWMCIAIVLILTLPRQKVVIAFLMAGFTIPFGQVVVFAGLHFTAMRILILVGLVRWLATVVSSGERWFIGGFRKLDRAVVFWSVSTLIVVSIRWMHPQALIKTLGDFLDVLGGYLAIRFMIPNRTAIIRTIKLLAVVAAIHGVVMVGEQITLVNVFGLLGGVQAGITPMVRGNGYRSGALLGCITSGFFGAAMLPMFVWLRGQGKSRLLGLVGILGAVTMVVTSYSSTSYIALAVSLAGLAFWPLRRRMRLLRWGAIAMLLVLQLFMKSPVWWLIKRADVTGSSASYHRAMIVDNCFRHFGEWWLAGTGNYVNWEWDSWDLCNEYVSVAMRGGLLCLILFLTIYYLGFSVIGDARKRKSGNTAEEWFFWCLGAALLVDAAAAFGMNYPPQVQLFWFPVLVFISVVGHEAGHASAERQRASSKQLQGRAFVELAS